MNRILQFLIFMFWSTLLYSQNVVIDRVTFSADGKTLIKYPQDKMNEEYIVPEGTEVIGESAFKSNYYLRTIILPLSLNKIDDHAFVGLYLTSVTWKHFPESIGKQLFGKSNVLIFDTLNDSDNCISVDGVLFSKDQRILLRFPNAKNGSEETYEIPEGTEVVSTRAFEDSRIYNRITLPSSLKLIENEAFAVEERTPTTLNARYGYYWIWNVVCNALIPPTIVGDPFINHYEVNLFVPEKSFDIYRNTPYWQDFRSINGDTGINTNRVGNSFSKIWIQSGILYLESGKEVETVDVYDANGVSIWSEYINNRTWELITSKLSKGLLLVKITTVDGNQETFKLLN
ncbi:leucine-rich repeat protein [Bacteroides sp.]|uniref:leucine-rich repeat protein n=1 Tax=Bacteroides sp. TaxID=29523 RepID=UPI0025C193FB|nr:leucine-rich repeat protein [Bacteroides sp.]